MRGKKKKRFDLLNVILIVLSALIIAAILYKLYVMLAPSLKLQRDSENLRESVLDEKDGAVDFAKLQGINPDICAWLTIDNTRIDYPVVQGSNNMEYLNKDAYGDDAIYGALFLDTRNNNTFQDPYSVIYGHHMQDGNMFGDLDRFRKEKFFKANKTGTLSIPTGKLKLKAVALLTVDCDDAHIYDPEIWREKNTKELRRYIRRKATFKRRISRSKRLLALSTCYKHESKERTVLILEID